MVKGTTSIENGGVCADTARFCACESVPQDWSVKTRVDLFPNGERGRVSVLQ